MQSFFGDFLVSEFFNSHRPLRSLTQLRGFHGVGSLRGSLRSRVRRGKSEHACSSNSCFAWLGLGFASTQLHAEHPQAAKVLSSSQTSCLAMAAHSPTAWSGLLGQFRAGHMGPECARFASLTKSVPKEKVVPPG